MSFWSFGVGIWSHSCQNLGFQLLKNSWSSLTYFSFNGAPNVLYRYGLQAGQFSTRTLLLRSHAVAIAEVCGFALSAEIHKAFSEIDFVWRGAYVALKPFILFSIPSAFQNMQAVHTVCTPIPSDIVAFELNTDNTLEGIPPPL